MSKPNEKLEKLKSKRKTERSNVTKLFNKIETVLNNENADYAELEECLAVLTQRADNLKTLDIQIEDLIDLALIDEENKLSDEYQENCIRFNCKIKRF